MEYTTKCENCGNLYDNYMRTFFIEEKGERKCVCLDCRKSLCKGKIWYTNHIPTFCDGGNLVTKIFESVADLADFILKKTDADDIATFGDYTIVDVSKSRKYWWVRGYVSHSLDLPTFNETIEKLGYID
jgi:hypothetical protein